MAHKNVGLDVHVDILLWWSQQPHVCILESVILLTNLIYKRFAGTCVEILKYLPLGSIS